MTAAVWTLAALTGWSTWAPRQEIAPKTWAEGEVLAISGNGNAAEHGAWVRQVDGLRGGQWYRFTAAYRAEGVPYENRQVAARLEWCDARGRRTGQPDYAYEATREGDWKRLRLDVPAPEKAMSAKVQLFLSNAPKGIVRWKDVKIEEISDPGPRNVSVASVNLRPRQSPSREANVARFAEVIDRHITGKVDLIVLPEGMTVVGTGKPYAEVSETVPGPTTEALGKTAARHKSWLVAGLYEREGHAIYNTAVLLDREGRLAGKYRKVYLPREELEAGLTPGSSYPVFRTDFGTVGIMICWDLQYNDPSRALAHQGAEIIALPIWGGNETLGRARAIEHRVFIASSGYDYPTFIEDPDGKTIAEAKENGTVAMATIDLNRRYLDPWLGDMRQRMHKELRTDVPVIAK
jgi:predicted amidohydrolase